MAQVENKPGVPTQDLSFLNKMKTVKEELEKLDLQGSKSNQRGSCETD